MAKPLILADRTLPVRSAPQTPIPRPFDLRTALEAHPELVEHLRQWLATYAVPNG